MEVKTKFSIGDEVYILDDYKIIRTKVLAVYYEKHGVAPASILYGFTVFPKRKESECFATKESLIKYLSK